MHGPFLRTDEPKTKGKLKMLIMRVWKDMDKDKRLCRKLVSSIAKRLQVVIDVGVAGNLPDQTIWGWELKNRSSQWNYLSIILCNICIF